MPPDPAGAPEIVVPPGLVWLSADPVRMLRGLARLARMRAQLDQHPETLTAPDRDEARDLRWMVVVLTEAVTDDDDCLEDTIIRMEASDDPLNEWNAMFLRALVDHYANRYPLP